LGITSQFGSIPIIPLLVLYPVASAVAAAAESVTSLFKEKVCTYPNRSVFNILSSLPSIKLVATT
jgi:hypothetical protein